jgi:hypothetical protein
MVIARVLTAALLGGAAPALAHASAFSDPVCAGASTQSLVTPGPDRIWNVRFEAGDPAPLRIALPPSPEFAPSDGQTSPRTTAVDYSHGYEVRLKVHKVASLATLPLFVTQYVLGQKLYDGSTGGVKTAHTATAVGVASLFGVNTVTGVWNLWEGRKDPAGRGRRFTHAIMMLGADAGFVATGLLAPDDDDPDKYLDRRSTHRTVALTSMAVATASYLMMLFWK